jgi:hypothetical protein
LPFYEVFFARPDLDLSVKVNATHNLRDYILANRAFPILHDVVKAFDERNGSSGN